MKRLHNLTPGAARRGGGRGIYPELPPILVDPTSIRPGLDMVRVRTEASAEPVAPGTWCLYLGHYQGMAIVLPAGARSEVPVPPWSIDEPEAILCDTVEPNEFMGGWAFGRSAQAHEVPISAKSMGRLPATAFDRGVVRGFDDQLAKRAYRPGSFVPYNDAVRDLAARYPDEHYAPPSRRLRTFMAEAAA